jgi:hypothetical protein
MLSAFGRFQYVIGNKELPLRRKQQLLSAYFRPILGIYFASNAATWFASNTVIFLVSSASVYEALAFFSLLLLNE